MIIDTKFTIGDTVCFMLQNQIEQGTIKEIEVQISREYKFIPAIIYHLEGGINLVNPPILCASRQEVANELLKHG